jgi:hypothetical protein
MREKDWNRLAVSFLKRMLLKLSVPIVVFDLDLPQIRACLQGFRGHLPQIGAFQALCLRVLSIINRCFTVGYLKMNARNTGWPCCPLALPFCAQHKIHRVFKVLRTGY